MAIYTVGQQITRALRLLGVLADGETPSATEMSDGIITLNQMIDSWNTERLSVYSTMDQVFTWPATQVRQTIGLIGGDFTGTCPTVLDDATYYVLNGISYPLALVNREQYSSITLKTSTSTLPQILFPNKVVSPVTDELMEMYMYPVPTQDLEIHIISMSVIAQVNADTDSLYLPAGYVRALAYNLAMEMAPEYGVEPSRQVVRIATVSKRDLKRINNPNDMMTMPVSVLPRRVYNVYSGDF